MDQEKWEIGTSSSHDPCAGKECSGGLNLETGYEDHDDKSVEILDDLCPRKSRDKSLVMPKLEETDKHDDDSNDDISRDSDEVQDDPTIPEEEETDYEDDESVEILDEDALLQMDALCRSPNNKLDAQPVEVDALIVEASIQKEVDAIEVVDRNVEIRADVWIGASELTDNVNVTLSTGESKNLSFSDYQPVEGIGNSEHHIVNETEVLEANLHCDDNASLNGKESPGCREVDPQSGIDAEVTAVAEDRVDCEDVGFGNDTEFLNVDDDEITEAVDDMPCAEDTRLVENSGWSSRTRAVAKYLQTLLDKEPAHGKKVLGMDSMLNGKTRKEASRMFFETLVLKTRDYIHVEQAKPFDNVSIRSRVKLMKSEF